MSELTDKVAALTAAVTAATSVEESAITLIQQIPALILAAAQGADPATLASIQAATDAIAAEGQKLAAAVTANTPATPAPAAPPTTP